MTDEPDYFLFIGSVDSESATTQMKAGGVAYRKKLLNSRPENWKTIAALVNSPACRGVIAVLRNADYRALCHHAYKATGSALLEAIANRPHIIFVHEAVFLNEEQRTRLDPSGAEPADSETNEPSGNDEDLFYGLSQEEVFGEIPDNIREPVNAMMRERSLNVYSYRTNAERSIIATRFVEDNERHLLFRVYVPSGRLYAQEAEALLGLFRDWLGQTGHRGVRQDGYTTTAGQVFEFFSSEGSPEGGVTRYIEDFTSFLDICVNDPERAAAGLAASGLGTPGAEIVVKSFATRARRITLDVRQRKEERVLTLKHEFENVLLETNGVTGSELEALINDLLPAPTPLGLMGGATATGATVNHIYSPQIIGSVAGPVIQNLNGTANFGPEAKDLLALITEYGGAEAVELQTAVHELEDDGARGDDRVVAKSRLKRFLGELGQRGLGLSLDVLQKYVEHKFGIA